MIESRRAVLKGVVIGGIGGPALLGAICGGWIALVVRRTVKDPTA